MFGGAVPVDQFMRLCLMHPKHGYYTTRQDVFGPKGDFVTAPEVSQVYGELLAVWIADIVRQMKHVDGRKCRYALAELGPGRGTLMSDILRVLSTLGLLPAEVHLVEASPILRAAQKRCLEQVLVTRGVKLSFHEALDHIPEAVNDDADSIPVIYIAQEFFDALPVSVFQRDGGGPWRERYVDIVRDNDHDTQSDPFHFRFVLAPRETLSISVWKHVLGPSILPQSPPEPLAAHHDDGEHVFELCADGLSLAEKLANRVARSGGAALIVDYGFDSDVPLSGNTLRAIRGHEIVPVLSEPGLCDVTADVNFNHLRQVVQHTEASFHGSITQRAFLLSLGAAARFRALGLAIAENTVLDHATADAKLQELQRDYDRLTSPDQMGTLYRAAVISHPSISPPAFSSDG
jgi:NADH dehydrogenase [ubiquinone] 1 alpha subcomplex assembly factor 7